MREDNKKRGNEKREKKKKEKRRDSLQALSKTNRKAVKHHGDKESPWER